MECDRERLAKSLGKVIEQLFSIEEKIYNAKEVQSLTWHTSQTGQKCDSKVLTDKVTTDTATFLDVDGIVTEYQELQRHLQLIEDYNVLVKLKVKLAKMIEPHWMPQWKSRMMQMIRGIRCELISPTQSSSISTYFLLSSDRTVSSSDSNDDTVSADDDDRDSTIVGRRYKVIIPLVPFFVGEKVVPGRECSVVFGTHSSPRIPRWSFPTLKLKNSSTAEAKPEDLDPLYVTKAVLGFVDIEMPTNLWYTILRGIEEEFQTTTLQMSDNIDGEDDDDNSNNTSTSSDSSKNTVISRVMVEAYGPKNQIYLHPQHYNSILYEKEYKKDKNGDNTNPLFDLIPGEWNTIDHLQTGLSKRSQILGEPERSLYPPSLGVIIGPLARLGAEVAVDAQIDRMIRLLFRDSTMSTMPGNLSNVPIGAVADQSSKRECARAVAKMLRIMKNPNTLSDAPHQQSYQFSLEKSFTSYIGNHIVANISSIAAARTRSNLNQYSYLIDWQSHEVKGKHKSVSNASSLPGGTSTACIFPDGKLPHIVLSDTVPPVIFCEKMIVGDHFSCDEFTWLMDFIVRIALDNIAIFEKCFANSARNTKDSFPSLEDDITDLSRPRGRLARTPVLMRLDYFENILSQLPTQLPKFPKALIKILDSYLQLEAPDQFYLT